MMKIACFPLLLLLLSSPCSIALGGIPPSGMTPGESRSIQRESSFVLSNNLLEAVYNRKDNRLSFGGLKTPRGKEVLSGGELFVIETASGQKISSSELAAEKIALVPLKADKTAFRFSDTQPGRALVASFRSPDGVLKIQWRAVLRNGSHYLRQELRITADKSVEMKEITGLSCSLDPVLNPSPRQSGKTRGSLIVTDHLFAALETPMGINTADAEKNTVQGKWSRKTTLNPGEVWEVSSVVGLLSPGQERRSFLSYLERERVMPYRPFVHYNSWYELGIHRNDLPDPAQRMTEEQCLKVVKVWLDKLFTKRKTSLDAFVWDDGWDEFNSLWDFHKMFPDGFKKIDSLARKQKSGIGTWLGPVGGYGNSKQLRLKNWNKNHPNNQVSNFQLSNKEYFDAFVGRCAQMVKDYDMRYFKFDGISTDVYAKGPVNEEDAEGILNVVRALRQKRGDLFVNCTVGSWPSPFWYRYVDSLWRQGGDWEQRGEGNSRDKWITGRDQVAYDCFVKESPLMPVSSLMSHGMILTRFGPQASMPRDNESMIRDIRCSFASGINLQELYIDADLINEAGDVLWDEIARNIAWIRRNADVLADVHWVGGVPAQGQVYGWAAWSPDKATLALRNPSPQEQTIETTLRKALDIPQTVKGTIMLKDSHADQRTLPGFSGKAVDIDSPLRLTLEPFEVLVYEGGKVK